MSKIKTNLCNGCSKLGMKREGKFHVDGKYLMCFQSETY